MYSACRESLVSVWCLLRHVPLFFRATPKTPLRVLGIVAFDTLHVLRTSQRLPNTRVGALAAFLDFEGCANAEWDHKRLCQTEYREIRQRLEDAGLAGHIEAYLRQLERLESTRPSPGGDHRRFIEVREYREAVARLSLATAAAIVNQPLDTHVELLFRVLMQCQIVDDVLDYNEDAPAGLPSFLTASASFPDALGWSADAAGSYAEISGVHDGPAILPFRLALRAFTLVTKVVIHTSPGAHQMVKTHA